MRNFGIGEGSTVWISVGSAVALVALWSAVASSGRVGHLVLPSPGEVANTAHSILSEGYANASLWEHVRASLARISLAAGIAIAAGVPIGLAMGLNRWAKGILDAPIEFYWPVPPLAYLPLMIIWLGIGEASKIAPLALAMLAPIAPPRPKPVCGLCHPSGRTRRWRSVPAVPSCFSPWCCLRHCPRSSRAFAYRLGRGLGHPGSAAELIAATRGIGFMIMSASHF